MAPVGCDATIPHSKVAIAVGRSGGATSVVNVVARASIAHLPIGMVHIVWRGSIVAVWLLLSM